VLGGGDYIERQRSETYEIKQKKKDDHKERSSDNYAWEVTLWILYLRADKVEVIPSVVGPNCRGHCGKQPAYRVPSQV